MQKLKMELSEYMSDHHSLFNNMDMHTGMMLCIKCNTIASILDPSFGNCVNDIGVCLMNQLSVSDQSDRALALFEQAKRCYRYSSREFAFVNAARLHLRYKKD